MVILIVNNKNNAHTNLQWLTTHSLLQYSSSHSLLATAGFGQPWRMHELEGGRWISPDCWPLTGGGLDNESARGGLMCIICCCWTWTCCWGNCIKIQFLILFKCTFDILIYIKLFICLFLWIYTSWLMFHFIFEYCDEMVLWRKIETLNLEVMLL